MVENIETSSLSEFSEKNLPPDSNNPGMAAHEHCIVWINRYKTASEPRNPHNIAKPYSNLAWLLQSTEVAVMRKVWQGMVQAGIIFLSVYDEVIIKISDQLNAVNIFRNVFSKEFQYYKITAKRLPANANDLNNDIHFSSNEFTSNSDWEHG